MAQGDGEKIFKDQLIFVDGVQTKLGEPLIDNLYPSEIKAINITSGKSAIEKYGTTGKEGVIEIITKAGQKEPNQTEGSTFVVYGERSNENPLIVVNGEKIGNERTFEELNIDANDVEKIDVLRDKAAAAMYGVEGKNGLIVITLKKGKTFEMPKKESGVTTQIKIRGTTNNSPLFVVDGKVVGKGKDEILDLQPDDIESINVLKDKAATDKYGDQGKEGVVEITMKAGVQHQYKEIPTEKKVNPALEIVRERGASLAKTKFLYGEYKGAMMRRMNPLIIFDGEVLDKKSKVEKQIKAEEIGNIAYGGPLPRDIEKYGSKAKDGVAYISRQINKKSDEIVVEGKFEETKDAEVSEQDDVALRVDFQGKVKIENGKSEGKSYEVDKMTFELKDLKEADTEKEATHLKFSSEDGINIKAFANKNVNQPLYVLDGVPLKASDTKIQNLDPKRVKSVELIESGPALNVYGAAAKYGVLIITTKPIVVEGVRLEQLMSNGMEIKDENDEFKDFIFRYGPEKDMKVVDPLVVVDGVDKGLQSQVGRNNNKNNVALMQFSGPNEKLIAQFGDKAKDGVVQITTKAAAALSAGSAKATGPSFQKEIEASLKVFPNPFGKETRINFNLPEAARTKISVFNASGQLVKVLQDAQLQAGPHQIDWNSERSPSGNYTVVIESLNTRISKTIIKQ